jgi:DAK2 domain fusion protein YloV
VTETNLVRFRAAVAGGLAHLESRRQEVNDLNVFPVADGDTGDNMVHTLRAVLAELDRLQGDDATRTIDAIGRRQIVESVAHAALLGARGNSGVILSQLIRGAAEMLVSTPGELIDPSLVARTLQEAASHAHGSVPRPAAGTILTVAADMAQAIAADVQADPQSHSLSPDADQRTQDLAIANTLERGVIAGQESVKRSPELLPALREAGVVDAGGYGLTIIFAGVIAVLRGETAPELDHYAPARSAARGSQHLPHGSTRYRFCTNFIVAGRDLAPERFLAALEGLGDSVMVVGDATMLKVHVHTDEPARATAVFDGAGEVSRLETEDMRAQMQAREARLEHRGGANANGAGGEDRCGAVAVVSGEGLRTLFAELGVHTIDGGQTLNPSTSELLEGIERVPAAEVVLLPNSPNVIMAAERAAELSQKPVRVVPAISQQAGLAAAVALLPERSAEQNAQALSEVLARVRTGAVAPAARRDPQGRFAPGEAVGFVDDNVVAWGEAEATLRSVLASLADGAELVSVLAGQDAPLDAATVSGLLDGDGDGAQVAELELRDGGQPAYWWLVAAE